MPSALRAPLPLPDAAMSLAAATGFAHAQATRTDVAQPPSLGELLIAFALAALWAFLVAPPPSYLVSSPETGHQLAGAWNLLHYGQQPLVDYVTSYGPGRFWVSALGISLGQGSLFGELLTRSTAFAVYLALLLQLLRATGASRALSWFLVGAAAIALPPSHKYWTALCPILTLWTMHRCSRGPSPAAHVALGASVGIAALFRPDYGLFALAGVLTLQLQPAPERQRGRDSLQILLGAAVVFVPWLFWLTRRVDVAALFGEWLSIGATQGVGMGLPHPLWHWADPLLSLAFACLVAAPLCGFWLLWRYPHAQASLQRFTCAACVFALVGLVQSSHRADWAHLLQGMVPGLVVIALIANWPTSRRQPLAWRAALPFVLGACLATAHPSVPSMPLEAWQRWSAAALDKPQFAERYLRGSEMGRVVDVVTRCVPADTPVAFYPFSPQLHYFAERPFAAALPYLAPGFFATPAQQQRAIGRLEDEKPPVLFWNEQHAYDNLAERNSTLTHAALFRYVLTHYARAGLAGAHTVFLRRDAYPAMPASCITAIADR